MPLAQLPWLLCLQLATAKRPLSCRRPSRLRRRLRQRTCRPRLAWSAVRTAGARSRAGGRTSTRRTRCAAAMTSRARLLGRGSSRTRARCGRRRGPTAAAARRALPVRRRSVPPQELACAPPRSCSPAARRRQAAATTRPWFGRATRGELKRGHLCRRRRRQPRQPLHRHACLTASPTPRPGRTSATGPVAAAARAVRTDTLQRD